MKKSSRAAGWGKLQRSLDRLADGENVSEDLKEVREKAMWVSQGRALLAEETAYAKALRKQHAWKSRAAQETRQKQAMGD